MTGIVQAQIGFAADERGEGIAYARTGRDGSARVLRVPFAVKRYPSLQGREIGYAALAAVACALRKRGVEAVTLTVDDAALAGDLCERREVPPALTLSYVRTRCVLNQFRRYHICAAPGAGSDLTARARSELALHVAA